MTMLGGESACVPRVLVSLGLGVFEAFVEAARAALPELDEVGAYAVAAPEVWSGDVFRCLELPLEGLVSGEELGVAGDFGRLMAGEGAELVCARTRRPISVALHGIQLVNRALDPDGPAQTLPEERRGAFVV